MKLKEYIILYMYPNRFWIKFSLLIQDFIHHSFRTSFRTPFTTVSGTVNYQNYGSAHKFWGPGCIIPTTLFGDDTGSISIVGIRVIPINLDFMWRAVGKGSGAQDSAFYRCGLHFGGIWGGFFDFARLLGCLFYVFRNRAYTD